MTKTTVVVNPIAGRGAGTRLSARIERRLHDLGLDFDLVTTQAPGDATALAEQAIHQGKELVVAVGGDGTSNEVLNGLVRAGANADGPALAILPIGTGNDFAFGAGVPLDLEAACQAVARARGHCIDVGYVTADNERDLYFGNGVGIGFDAVVNMESRKLKRLRGFLVYLVAVFRTLAFYYNVPGTRVCVDGWEVVQPSLMISIMNGCRFGGGFHVTPGSRMNDGLFDLCVTLKISRPEMVAFVPRFMRGSHTSDPRITMVQGHKVTVISDSPWAAHVDGEIYGVGASRFEIELLPQRLHLII
ncbi:MAG: diacylglycerol/lipid kinase family protein [Anaerolineae bacterium]